MEKATLEKNPINEETVTKESLERFLSLDTFYEEIKSIDEANNFKKFLDERFTLLLKNEKTAERNFNNNPLLRDYHALRNESNKIDRFMYDEFDAEYGSEEWKAEEKKIDDLDQRAEKILENDPELKKLAKELGDTWNQASREKDAFLRESKALDKIKIIDEVLVPYFEQEDKVNHLSNKGKEELIKKRDVLYENLEKAPEDKNLEGQIRTVEWDLEHFDSSLQIEISKLERMKNKLSSSARRIYSTISPL